MNESKLSLIFDLDGTLWNPIDTIYNTWKKEFSITKEELIEIIGNTNEKIISTLKIDNNKLYDLQKKENAEIIKNGGLLFDNVLKIISRLEKKYDLYIVSNCQKGYIEAFLIHYNLTNYFKDYTCSGDTGKNKKINLKYLIKKNKIRNAIFIGDTKSDLESANYSNIPFIYASYGFGNLKTKHTINSLNELPKMIKEVCNSIEYRDLYDANKCNIYERVKKGNKIPKNRYYITVIIFIENDKKELLMQVNKKYDKWSITGGHPKCGESSIEGAQTELREELNLDVKQKELKLLKTLKTEDDFVDLYYLKKNIDINELKTQDEEVGEVNWFTNKEIDKLIKNNEFLTAHIDIYNIFIQYINKLKDLDK